MNTFELKVWNDERKLCTFYTVQNEGRELTEMDDFLAKYVDSEAYKKELEYLLIFLFEIVGDRGAEDYHFRPENKALGLPPKGKITQSLRVFHFKDFPLRLFAIKINKNVVILLNGGIKDNTKAQTSSLSPQWYEAQNFAKRIDQAILSREIVTDVENIRKLLNDQGGEEIILF